MVSPILQSVETKPFFYSPASIVAIINAGVVIKEEKKLVQVRGVFRKEGKMNYGGCFYNRIKDEANDNYLTLLTPALIHSELEDNKTIELNGYITRKVNSKNGSIEINLNLIELLTQQVNKFSEEDVKRIDIINRKLGLGFKDLDSCIKKAVFDNSVLRIKVIAGKSAIIDTDIKKGMGGMYPVYQIEFVRVTLTSIAEITAMLKQLDDGKPHLICIARGGGENLDVFEQPAIAEALLQCKSILATAIGHAENVTLTEKVADKKFITPTQFGNYLKESYTNAVEELENSKAKLVQDVTNSLTANYGKQIQNLEQQLMAEKQLHQRTQDSIKKVQQDEISVYQTKLKNGELLMQETTRLHQDRIVSLTSQNEQKDKLLQQSSKQLETAQSQLKESQSNQGFSIVALVVAVIIGIIIGVMMAGRH